METWIAAAALAAIAAGSAWTKAKRHAPRTSGRTRRPHTSQQRHYPGDYQGKVTVEYVPSLDGDADPGEIVWTWVPYEEDHSKGKDRPVLIIGRDGRWLLGLMLSSKDHSDEPHRREKWLDIGTGDWDRQRRPSEVRLDRIIRVDPHAVRREGAIVSQRIFDEVSHSLSSLHHW